MLYELHVGTFSAEGTFDGAIPHLAELADVGITAIELMPVAEFPGTRGWGYDGVFLGAAQSSYGGPHGLARLVDAAHAAGPGRGPRRGPQPPRAHRCRRRHRLRARLHRHLQHAVGRGPQLRRRPLRPRAGVGAPERGLVARTPAPRRPAPRRGARPVRPQRHPPGRRGGRPGPPHPTRRAGDRRERAQRPQGDPPARAGRLGVRRPVGRRPPPRPAGAAHRRRRRLLRRLRHRGRPGQGPAPPLRARRPVVRRAAPPLRRPGRRPPAGAVRGVHPGPRPGGQPGPGRPAAGRDPPPRRPAHAALAVHAHAVPGRGVRRGRALPVLHRPHRPGHRRGHPAGPAPRVRRLRRLLGRGGARPPGPGHLRALQAHPPGGPPPGRALPHPAAHPGRPAAGRRRGHLRRGRPLAADAPGPLRGGGQPVPRPTRPPWPTTPTQEVAVPTHPTVALARRPADPARPGRGPAARG